MVEPIPITDPERVRARLADIREQVTDAAGQAGTAPGAVEILAATKYVRSEDLPTLAAAGVKLVGENRASDLAARAETYGGLFAWDFIGTLQSRRVRTILPHVRLIHSVASTSALRELERHRALAHPELAILIEVNIAREPGKSGIAPEELDAHLERAPVPVVGLMCMPPLASDPEQSRRWFAATRELASARGLSRLSMGTSQDYLVAVQEGATIVRIGTSLYS
ncbi:MAG TPA: YggS family pyridoxal phosphate-dependent enzyme [Solirubrobacteraceae bacterium]